MPEASPQAPPRSLPPQTPADKALAAEGGEIVPKEFRPQNAELNFDQVRGVVEERHDDAAPAPPTESPKQRVIDVQGGLFHPGDKLPPGIPEPPPKSPEQIAFEEQLKGMVNFELNILNVCCGAVRNMVAMRLQMEPPDSAELGQAMFGAGVRTPIEQAEPQMAIEVYREVRRSMREEPTREVKPGILRRALRAVFGR